MSSAALAYPAKSAEAFRTISEVAEELDVPQHVLRFWESRFTQVRPVKRAGGRRYYRPEDIDLLKGIRALLHGEGFTIKGVQKVLKERGVRHVAEVGRGGAISAKAPPPVVIEKIVYVQKVPVRKRPAHLRAVSAEMSLPFFDTPEDVAPEPEDRNDGLNDGLTDRLADAECARLNELLDALTALKFRLTTARAGRLA